MHRRKLLPAVLILTAGISVSAAPQWADLGVAMTGKPAIIANRDGRLAVFVRGPDNALWSVSQTAPGARTWSAAESLGGSMVSNPAAGIDAEGRLDVFAINSDNAIWHQWWG